MRDAAARGPTAETVAWENCMNASATVTATKGSVMDTVRSSLRYRSFLFLLRLMGNVGECVRVVSRVSVCSTAQLVTALGHETTDQQLIEELT